MLRNTRLCRTLSKSQRYLAPGTSQCPLCTLNQGSPEVKQCSNELSNGKSAVQMLSTGKSAKTHLRRTGNFFATSKIELERGNFCNSRKNSLRFLSTAPEKEKSEKSGSDLIITEHCAEKLAEILKPGEYLRILVDSGGCSGFEYKFSFDTSEPAPDDLVFSADPQNPEIRIVVDELSLDLIRGATVDYRQELIKASFKIVSNPIAEQGCSCGSSFAVKLD